jgi:F-type H+-transporting ATPase subunit a
MSLPSVACFMTPPLRNKLFAAVPLFWLGSAGLALAAAPGEAISPYPYAFDFYGLPITNSMMTTWVFSLVAIVLIRWMVGKPQLIPGRGQAVIENMLTGLRDLVEPILGPRLVDKVMPLLLTLFTFILIMNWSGLIPGVGTVGMLVKDSDGVEHFRSFFRPANSDLNTPVALALISCTAWVYYVLRYAGLKTLVHDLFGNKADRNDVPTVVYYIFYLLFILIGLIEVLTILVRPLSLSFRLYGNVFGGENLLDTMSGILPYIAPLPFYLLEFFIGLLQAFIFTLLTAVYIGQICNHEESAQPAGAGTPAH